jgi:hypothetical protein
MFSLVLRCGFVAALFVAVAAGTANAASLITQADFVSPTIVTFDGQNGTFTFPTTYSDSGATFQAGGPGQTFYLYLDIMDVNNLDTLNVSFSTPMNRFGFMGNASNPNISNPSSWTVTQTDFFSDSSFTNLVDTYTTPVTIDPSGTFYGLQSTVPFRSVRISVTPVNGGFSAYLDDFEFEANTVPEPGSFGLLLAAVGAGGLLMIRRRTR